MADDLFGEGGPLPTDNDEPLRKARAKQRAREALERAYQRQHAATARDLRDAAFPDIAEKEARRAEELAQKNASKEARKAQRMADEAKRQEHFKTKKYRRDLDINRLRRQGRRPRY